MRIKQADFAALISGTLNIPFPTNSVGRFPSAAWENQSFAYDSLNANFRQIHEMMDIKKSLVTNGMLPFSPYADEDKIHQLVISSFHLYQISEYENAVSSMKGALLNLIAINNCFFRKYFRSTL